MKEVMGILHKRHEFLEQKYGRPVRVAAHCGEGVYLGGSLLLSHEILYWVYGTMFVVWIAHSIIIGLEE